MWHRTIHKAHGRNVTNATKLMSDAPKLEGVGSMPAFKSQMPNAASARSPSAALILAEARLSLTPGRRDTVMDVPSRK